MDDNWYSGYPVGPQPKTYFKRDRSKSQQLELVKAPIKDWTCLHCGKPLKPKVPHYRLMVPSTIWSNFEEIGRLHFSCVYDEGV